MEGFTIFLGLRRTIVVLVNAAAHLGTFGTFCGGLVAGAVGYLMTQLWMQPIVRYRDSKYSVIVELVVYANEIALMPNELFEGSRVADRTRANRQRAADLRATYWTLPGWYRAWLRFRNEDPQIAARELIGLSNTITDHQEAARRREAIKSALRLPRNLG